MADIFTVIENLRADNEFNIASNLPDVQFTTPRLRAYLGATLMPESLRDENQYDEEDFQFTDLIAADVDAYSPPPLMGTFAQVSGFNVRMGDSGLAIQMSTKLYSQIMRLLVNTASMERVADQILGFNTTLTQAMLSYNERQRWNAIVTGVVRRRIAQTFEDIIYPNAAGQRAALTAAWSDDTYDPWPDIFAQRSRATSLGYGGVRRIISTQASVDILLNNAHTQRRIGQVTIVGNEEYVDFGDLGRLNAYLSRNGFPAIETYDETWRSQTGSGRYLAEGTMVFVYDTGRNVEDVLDLEGDAGISVPDAQNAGLGYTAIGTPAGHEDVGPGRWQEIAYHGGSRPNVSGEGVQKGLPVFSDPSAFSVISAIR